MTTEKRYVTYKLTTPEGQEYEITAYFLENYGFDYGNHHGLAIVEQSGYDYCLDARYDGRFNTVEGFYKNILDVLKDRYRIAKAELIAKQ